MSLELHPTGAFYTERRWGRTGKRVADGKKVKQVTTVLQYPILSVLGAGQENRATRRWRQATRLTKQGAP